MKFLLCNAHTFSDADFLVFLFQKIAAKGAHLKISFQMRPFAFFSFCFLSDQSVMLHRLCHAVPLDGIGYVLCVRIPEPHHVFKRNGIVPHRNMARSLLLSPNTYASSFSS